MKAALLALFIALLMGGCGEDVVDGSKLQNRNRVTYLPNEETLFTGQAESFHVNGQKREEGYLKDGKRVGFYTFWYENGQKKTESNFKDGKLISAVRWKPNGDKCPVTNVKDGNGVVVVYNEDGTEERRVTFKDSEVVD